MRCAIVAFVVVGAFCGLAGCELLQTAGVAGVTDAIGDLPPSPPTPGTDNFGGHAVNFLMYLAAYAAGSLGKGFVRSKVKKA